MDLTDEFGDEFWFGGEFGEGFGFLVWEDFVVEKAKFDFEGFVGFGEFKDDFEGGDGVLIGEEVGVGSVEGLVKLVGVGGDFVFDCELEDAVSGND